MTETHSPRMRTMQYSLQKQNINSKLLYKREVTTAPNIRYNKTPLSCK